MSRKGTAAGGTEGARRGRRRRRGGVVAAAGLAVVAAAHLVVKYVVSGKWCVVVGVSLFATCCSLFATHDYLLLMTT